MLRWMFAATLALLGADAHAALVADYRFQNNLHDILATAPDLTAIVPADGSFATETVGIAARTVRLFSSGGGFQLSSDGLIDNTGSTIAILLRLDRTLGYAKVLDTSARLDDAGVYARISSLLLYPQLEGDAPRLPSGEWHQVVVTRTAVGQYSGYVDGFRLFAGADGGYGEISQEQMLSFVVDDTGTNGEQSGGAIARIRLYDRVLDADHVAALDDNQIVFRAGFETIPD